MPKEKNIKQMLLTELLEDSMTKSEVLDVTKKLITYVKELKEKSARELEAIREALQIALNNVKNDTATSFNTEKGILTSSVEKRLKNADKMLDDKIKEIDFKVSQIKNGEDADEERVTEKVVSMIKIPTIEELKDQLPVMGEEVRDSLELLQGDDRLDASAIKGLEKFISKTSSNAIGGLRPNPTGVEIPSGAMNSVNKAFTVSFMPQYITWQGQSLYADNGYTITSASGVLTITLDTAPDVGDVLRNHY